MRTTTNPDGADARVRAAEEAIAGLGRAVADAPLRGLAAPGAARDQHDPFPRPHAAAPPRRAADGPAGGDPGRLAVERHRDHRPDGGARARGAGPRPRRPARRPRPAHRRPAWPSSTRPSWSRARSCAPPSTRLPSTSWSGSRAIADRGGLERSSSAPRATRRRRPAPRLRPPPSRPIGALPKPPAASPAPAPPAPEKGSTHGSHAHRPTRADALGLRTTRSA